MHVSKAAFSEEWSFEALSKAVLVEKGVQPTLSPTCFAISSPEEIKSIVGDGSPEDALPPS